MTFKVGGAFPGAPFLHVQADDPEQAKDRWIQQVRPEVWQRNYGVFLAASTYDEEYLEMWEALEVREEQEVKREFVVIRGRRGL